MTAAASYVQHGPYRVYMTLTGFRVRNEDKAAWVGGVYQTSAAAERAAKKAAARP